MDVCELMVDSVTNPTWIHVDPPLKVKTFLRLTHLRLRIRTVG